MAGLNSRYKRIVLEAYRMGARPNQIAKQFGLLKEHVEQYISDLRSGKEAEPYEAIAPEVSITAEAGNEENKELQNESQDSQISSQNEATVSE